jgi:hypothetical protein
MNIRGVALMHIKKLLPFTIITSVCLLMQCCCVGKLLPDTPIPERTLEINDEYEIIWSLSSIYMNSCARSPLMVSAPGIIFAEASHSVIERSVLAINSLDGKALWQIEPS